MKTTPSMAPRRYGLLFFMAALSFSSFIGLTRFYTKRSKYIASGLEWAIFSKKYNNSANPKSDFCAAMVCSEADKSCPSVDGADLRVGLPYEDPKYFDNTPSQDEKYDERCRQIATEMFFTMDYVRQKLNLKVESKK